MLTGPGWRAVLDGDVRIRAESALRSIARDLAVEEPHTPEPAARGQAVARAILPTGAAGAALFYAHLSRRDGREYCSRTARLLDDAIGVVASVPMGSSLHGGFTGVGWVVQHVSGWCLDAEDEDPLGDLDETLLRFLDAPSVDCDHDLISGLVGFGVYALERWPRPAARRCLQRVVHHLAAQAEHTASGVSWRTAPAHLPARERELFPEGYYALGVAHGIAAVAVLLAGASARGMREEVRPLLDGAIRFLLSCDEPDSHFPACVHPSIPTMPTRSAWCHGDPGIAVALFAAARALDHQSWSEEALRIARRSLRRAPAESGADEPGLCHGAAGLAHMYNRLYQATGAPEFRDGARFWFERTLTLLASEPEPGFLMGRAGIGLALLSAVAPLEPTWDRVLCLSLPADAS